MGCVPVYWFPVFGDGSIRLSMSFQTLNHPSHNWGNRYKHGVVSKFRSNRAISVPPSSILLQTDESGNFPKPEKSSGSLINQDNTVGIIGGVSAESSLYFLRKLVQLSSKDGNPSLPFVLCSDSELNKELLIYERSSLSLRSGKGSHHSQFNHQPIIENLQRKRAFLECSGARCISMPCHVSHWWHDEVSRGCSVPFLHMGECVAKELKEAKLKPLEAGSPLRIGVLATSATLTAGFYQDRLQREGFEVVLPDKATMEHAVIPAIEAINRKDMEGARNLLRIALQVLLVRAVNNIILGSNDMWDLLPRDDPLFKKCVDPMDALARSIIKWAHSVQKDT